MSKYNKLKILKYYKVKGIHGSVKQFWRGGVELIGGREGGRGEKRKVKGGCRRAHTFEVKCSTFLNAKDHNLEFKEDSTGNALKYQEYHHNVNCK